MGSSILSPLEKEEKVKQEVQDIEKVEQPLNNPQSTNQSSHSEYVRNYMNVEKSVSEVFTNYNSSNFDVLSQQRIGNRFEIDILLKSKTEKYLDRIIEIKYFKNQLPLKIIRDIIIRLNTQISFYVEASKRGVIPVLLIVYNKESISAENLFKFQNRIIDESQGLPNMARLKIEFIEENEIQKFDVRRIIQK